MRRMPALVAVLSIVVLPCTVLAAPGLHLSWDHCFADGQVANRSFACSTNGGGEVLDLSFESPVAASDRVGVEMVVHFTSSDGALPDWWRVSGTGSCRSGALAFALFDPNSIACDQPILGLNGAGGIADLLLVGLNPPVWRLRAVAAVPAGTPFAVGPGSDTFVMQLIVRNLKTVGSPSCAGCLTPICIGFGSANIVEATNTNPIFLTAGGPNTGGGPANVTWQGAYTSGYSFTGSDLSLGFSCAPSRPVPVRATTWGAIKAVYR